MAEWCHEEDWSCWSAECRYIGTQEAWDAYQFGGEQSPFVVDGGVLCATGMWTTDGVRHEMEADCQTAGCACQ